MSLTERRAPERRTTTLDRAERIRHIGSVRGYREAAELERRLQLAAGDPRLGWRFRHQAINARLALRDVMRGFCYAHARRVLPPELRPLARYVIGEHRTPTLAAERIAVLYALRDAGVLRRNERGTYYVIGFHLGIAKGHRSYSAAGNEYPVLDPTFRPQAFLLQGRFAETARRERIEAPLLEDIYEPTSVSASGRMGTARVGYSRADHEAMLAFVRGRA